MAVVYQLCRRYIIVVGNVAVVIYEAVVVHEGNVISESR